MQSPREVRAFRLDKNVLRMIQMSARRHGVSENALVEGILAKNLRTDPLLHAIDYICVGKETFTSLLESTDANALEMTGAERGKKSFSLSKDLFESNELDLSFPRYILEILGEQARWFRAEGATVRPERMTLQHDYGTKWSGFLKAYLSSAYEVVSRNKLELSATTDYVHIRIPETTFQ